MVNLANEFSENRDESSLAIYRFQNKSTPEISACREIKFEPVFFLGLAETLAFFALSDCRGVNWNDVLTGLITGIDVDALDTSEELN